ncbi:hypothetical protein L3Q82_011359 [Scortum barcoo]|uniref:Uncharacterized protein n=1 Tax=Scortum barcoo TaxID=214431 RepID=A0ACB8W9K4_9TELE|nr:hypothetical protein L3Q82_011359 [Scortum barcoo]
MDYNVFISSSFLMLLFHFTGVDATTSPTTRNQSEKMTTSEETNNNHQTKQGGWWQIIVVSVGGAALLIIVVVVIRWKKTKVSKRQVDVNMKCCDVVGWKQELNCVSRWSFNTAATESGPEVSQDMADPEDGVSYASVTYTKKSNSKAQSRMLVSTPADSSDQDNNKVKDSLVHLSVINMNEQKDDDKVTLNCSVSSYDQCRHTVKWLYEGKDVDKDNKDLQDITDWLLHHCDCATTTTTSPTTRNQSVKMTTSEETNNNHQTNQGGWWIIVVSVGLSGLLISVVAVNIWTRTKENKTQTDENTEHHDEDEDEGSVKYENFGEPSAVSVRL